MSGPQQPSPDPRSPIPRHILQLPTAKQDHAQVLSYNDRLPGMDVCVKHMRTDNLPDCVFPQGRPTGPSAAPSGSLQPPSDPLPAPANPNAPQSAAEC